MTSFIWERDPQEAYQNPYEYEAQDQFYREASKLLQFLFDHMMQRSGTYTRDDRSSEKAIWMLFLDSLESLKDCLELLKDKKHRIAGRLLRDAAETMDTASYFCSNDTKRNKYLNDWYNDKVVPNSVYRDFVKQSDEVEWEKLKNYYKQLSKINHRTYRSLAYSYALGSKERLVYEGAYSNSFMILPHAIAMYYALIGNLIRHFVTKMIDSKIISSTEVKKFWDEALEKEDVERRFISPKEVLKRYLEEADDIT